jgi:hypothetical protein
MNGLASKKDRELGYDVAARITIKDAAGMTSKGRSQIARWLRRQADNLEADGGNYSTRFVSKYWYKI